MIRKVLIGRIVVVQEDRFRLTEESGRSYLLTLSNRAEIGSEELRLFRDAGAVVEVEYEGEPNLASGVADHVEA